MSKVREEGSFGQSRHFYQTPTLGNYGALSSQWTIMFSSPQISSPVVQARGIATLYQQLSPTRMASRIGTLMRTESPCASQCAGQSVGPSKNGAWRLKSTKTSGPVCGTSIRESGIWTSTGYTHLSTFHPSSGDLPANG